MERGRPWPPSTSECYLCSCGDLVDRRVGNLVRLKLRRPLDDLSQRLQHFRIRLDAGIQEGLPRRGDESRRELHEVRLRVCSRLLTRCLRKRNRLDRDARAVQLEL